MNKKTGAALAILVVAAVVGYFFIARKPRPETNIVRIGAVLPLTGDVAAYGKDSKDGIDLAVELANKSQTQYKFEVSYEDSRGDPKTAVTALQSLLSAKSPVAVIGENITSSTAAMIPVIDRAKVLLISPSASAPNLSGTSQYFFRVFPSDSEEGAFVVEAVAKRFPNGRVCIVYVNNDYGVGLKNIFEAKAKQNNISVTGSFGYEKASTDFKAILAKVKALGVDAVYMPGYYQDGGLLLKQAKELGIAAQFYGSTAQEDPKLLEIAENAAEGFQYPVSTGFEMTSEDSSVKKFIADFTSKFQKDPGLVSSLGYDCANILVSGVIKNGPTADGIRNYVLNTKDIPGAAGVMNFDDRGDVHKPIILKIVKDGKFSIL